MIYSERKQQRSDQSQTDIAYGKAEGMLGRNIITTGGKVKVQKEGVKHLKELQKQWQISGGWVYWLLPPLQLASNERINVTADNR